MKKLIRVLKAVFAAVINLVTFRKRRENSMTELKEDRPLSTATQKMLARMYENEPDELIVKCSCCAGRVGRDYWDLHHVCPYCANSCYVPADAIPDQEPTNA